MIEEFYVDSRVYKGQILYRGIQNGRRIQEKIKYKPYLFLDTQEQSKYKTLDGKFVKKKIFDNISEARQFVRDHEDLSGFKYYGLTNYEYLYIYDNFPGTIKFDRKQISIVGLDIETHHEDGFPDPKLANQEITLITITKNGKAYMFGCKPYTPKTDNVVFYLCENEKTLLQKFLSVWCVLNIDIITGWHVAGFDIPYLINRIVNILGEDEAKLLSPWNIIEGKEINTKFGSTQQSFDIYGITILDYLDLYKKFSYKNQESFKLDHIAYVELGKQKIDYSEYGTLDRLHDLNWELYCDYNLLDAVLIDELDAKLGYINIVLTMAYLMKCNYQDTLKTVRPWDVCIHAYLMDKNIVIPQAPQYKNSRDLVGGAVKDVIPGMYEWMASFDIKSSYPHQIITLNISPETFVKKINETIDYENLNSFEIYEKHSQYAKDNNLSMAGNLTLYSKDKRGFFAEIMMDFFGKRQEALSKLDLLEKEYNEILKELNSRNL